MAKNPDKKTQKTQKTQTKTQEFVVVTITNDYEQAGNYQALLKANDIPAEINQQNDPTTESVNFALTVPEDCIDEAHVIIESQDAYDDFYDLTLEENDDFESEFLDDDF